MKSALTLILITLLSCRGTKFIYISDEKLKKYGELTPFKLDDAYDCYVRQVIKVFDSTKKLWVPVNGKVSEATPLIEIEYLLISRSKKKVLVINNIPDKAKTFYNSDDKIIDLGITADTVKIDIWYFSQFRFGQLENGNLIFKNADGSKTTHLWNFNDSEDGIKLNTISVADSFGEDIRIIDKAFALEMLFVKADKFQILFKNNRNKGMQGAVPESILANQTIYVANKNKEIICKFDTTIHRHFKTVLFHKERMYAPPGL